MRFFIRPAEATDLDALETLIGQVQAGVTSLAIDRRTLRERIDESLASFAKEVSVPGTERYLFVLEELGTNEIAGMCAIKAAVGLTDAYYSYRIGTIVHASKELGVHRKFPALYLSNDYTGCTELTSLFLAPAHRGKGFGTLLSKSRLLFIAELPQRFADKIIAEIRGISDEQGRSPFWDSLGQHFFAMDFPTADHLVGTGNKAFIAELMPKHPIYVLFLSTTAQEVIGKPHQNSRGAMHLLEDEGFHYESYVDIFDAGPTIECRRDDIRSVRKSRRLTSRVGTVERDTPKFLLTNARMRNFRCCLGHAGFEGSDTIIVDEETARALLISEGDAVRVVES
jgi:arginine N-succinyltransferase